MLEEECVENAKWKPGEEFGVYQTDANKEGADVTASPSQISEEVHGK